MNHPVFADYEHYSDRQVRSIAARYEACLDALYETTLVPVKRLNLTELLYPIIERVADLSRTRNAFIATLDESGEFMTFRVETGFNSSMMNYQFRRGEGLIGQVWKENRIVAVDDYSIWSCRVPTNALDRVRAAIGVPLHSEEQVVGVLALISQDPLERFDDEQVYMLKRFARLASLAIDNATLHTSLQRELGARRKNEEAVRRLAYYQPTTDMPNRNYFIEKVPEMLHDRGQRAAIVALDFDRFSIINDIAGYEAGDELLAKVIRSVESLISQDSIVANVWGDKFLIAIPGNSAAIMIDALAESILGEIRQAWRINEHEFFLSASMGISFFPEDGDNVYSLMRFANMAALQAKEYGGNTYHFYTEQLSMQAQKRHDMERHLRYALNRDEFHLLYQPRIDMVSCEIASVEALIRWDNSELGAVSPADFIPLAESSGLISKIGEWVIRNACRQMKEWKRDGMIMPVSVNLSPQQFYQKDLVSFIRNMLYEGNISPSMLELEVTESAVIRDIEHAIALLRALKDLGVRLAMDDFGTGYSSLTSLRSLPLDTLKIDKAFVQDAEHSPESSAIVQTVIALGHALNMRVTAEGIETVQQLSLLRRLGCDEVQGFYFSRPVSAHAISEMFLYGNAEAMKMKDRRAHDSSSL
jgi:diguanylate cyclase (GGDEF)-like protein